MIQGQVTLHLHFKTMLSQELHYGKVCVDD